MLLDTIDSEQATPSLSQAQRMKKLSGDGKLSDDTMLSIMMEQKKPENWNLTLPMDRIRKFFPRSFTPQQMENTILKLLEAWQKKNKFAHDQQKALNLKNYLEHNAEDAYSDDVAFCKMIAGINFDSYELDNVILLRTKWASNTSDISEKEEEFTQVERTLVNEGFVKDLNIGFVDHTNPNYFDIYRCLVLNVDDFLKSVAYIWNKNKENTISKVHKFANMKVNKHNVSLTTEAMKSMQQLLGKILDMECNIALDSFVKGEMPKPKFDTYMNKYVEAKQLLPKITENWEKQKTTQEKIKAAIKNKNEKMQLKSAEREIREKMKKEIKFLRADYEYRKEQENKTEKAENNL